MKLTQKTIFQCFDKSRKQLPAVNSSPVTNLCSPAKKASIEEIEIHAHQPDFLLPIHIRQLSQTPQNNQKPLFNERVTDDGACSPSNQDFYRICPTVIESQIGCPNIEFIKLSTIERQSELFHLYTVDKTIIDWNSMFEGLQNNRKKFIEQNQYEQFLWTELYRPRTSKTYFGNHTRQIKRLNEWFSYWTRKLQNEQPETIVGKKRKRGSDDDDDSENFDENSTDNSNTFSDSCGPTKPQHPRLIFIHGQGTTCLVHALAEEYNFKVTEINGSQCRARAPLLKQLEQVTSHHHLSFKRCPSDTIMSQESKTKSKKEELSLLPAKKRAKKERESIASYFNHSKHSENDDEQKENRADFQMTRTQLNKRAVKKQRSKVKQEEPSFDTFDSHFVSSVQVEKTSLILFDEIETLTIDDNFWSSLKKLLETAKKPIILTSNSRVNPEDAIINLSKLGHYELIHLEPNDTELVCTFLRLILLIEMFDVPSLDDILKVYRHCSCDLRQTISTLQFLAQSSVIKTNNSKKYSEENDSMTSVVKWPSAQSFDAMYYSHLNEKWNNSLLKVYFDNLTSNYTSKYKRCNRLLLNKIQNDTKRIELYDTFKLFMQEEDMHNIMENSSFYLDYRPYIQQICRNEQNRANESNSNRRLRHCLSFRGCSLQWSDFEILSAGMN